MKASSGSENVRRLPRPSTSKSKTFLSQQERHKWPSQTAEVSTVVKRTKRKEYANEAVACPSDDISKSTKRSTRCMKILPIRRFAHLNTKRQQRDVSGDNKKHLDPGESRLFTLSQRDKERFIVNHPVAYSWFFSNKAFAKFVGSVREIKTHITSALHNVKIMSPNPELSESKVQRSLFRSESSAEAAAKGLPRRFTSGVIPTCQKRSSMLLVNRSLSCIPSSSITLELDEFTTSVGESFDTPKNDWRGSTVKHDFKTMGRGDGEGIQWKREHDSSHTESTTEASEVKHLRQTYLKHDEVIPSWSFELLRKGICLNLKSTFRQNEAAAYDHEVADLATRPHRLLLQLVPGSSNNILPGSIQVVVTEQANRPRLDITEDTSFSVNPKEAWGTSSAYSKPVPKPNQQKATKSPAAHKDLTENELDRNEDIGDTENTGSALSYVIPAGDLCQSPTPLFSVTDLLPLPRERKISFRHNWKPLPKDKKKKPRVNSALKKRLCEIQEHYKGKNKIHESLIFEVRNGVLFEGPDNTKGSARLERGRKANVWSKSKEGMKHLLKEALRMGSRTKVTTVPQTCESSNHTRSRDSAGRHWHMDILEGLQSALPKKVQEKISKLKRNRSKCMSERSQTGESSNLKSRGISCLRIKEVMAGSEVKRVPRHGLSRPLPIPNCRLNKCNSSFRNDDEVFECCMDSFLFDDICPLEHRVEVVRRESEHVLSTNTQPRLAGKVVYPITRSNNEALNYQTGDDKPYVLDKIGIPKSLQSYSAVLERNSVQITSSNHFLLLTNKSLSQSKQDLLAFVRAQWRIALHTGDSGEDHERLQLKRKSGGPCHHSTKCFDDEHNGAFWQDNDPETSNQISKTEWTLPSTPIQPETKMGQESSKSKTKNPENIASPSPESRGNADITLQDSAHSADNEDHAIVKTKSPIAANSPIGSDQADYGSTGSFSCAVPKVYFVPTLASKSDKLKRCKVMMCPDDTICSGLKALNQTWSHNTHYTDSPPRAESQPTRNSRHSIQSSQSPQISTHSPDRASVKSFPYTYSQLSGERSERTSKPPSMDTSRLTINNIETGGILQEYPKERSQQNIPDTFVSRRSSNERHADRDSVDALVNRIDNLLQQAKKESSARSSSSNFAAFGQPEMDLEEPPVMVGVQTPRRDMVDEEGNFPSIRSSLIHKSPGNFTPHMGTRSVQTSPMNRTAMNTPRISQTVTGELRKDQAPFMNYSENMREQERANGSQEYVAFDKALKEYKDALEAASVNFLFHTSGSAEQPKRAVPDYPCKSSEVPRVANSGQNQTSLPTTGSGNALQRGCTPVYPTPTEKCPCENKQPKTYTCACRQRCSGVASRSQPVLGFTTEKPPQVVQNQCGRPKCPPKTCIKTPEYKPTSPQREALAYINYLCTSGKVDPTKLVEYSQACLESSQTPPCQYKKPCKVRVDNRQVNPAMYLNTVASFMGKTTTHLASAADSMGEAARCSERVAGCGYANMPPRRLDEPVQCTKPCKPCQMKDECVQTVNKGICSTLLGDCVDKSACNPPCKSTGKSNMGVQVTLCEKIEKTLPCNNRQLGCQKKPPQERACINKKLQVGNALRCNTIETQLGPSKNLRLTVCKKPEESCTNRKECQQQNPVTDPCGTMYRCIDSDEEPTLPERKAPLIHIHYRRKETNVECPKEEESAVDADVTDTGMSITRHIVELVKQSEQIKDTAMRISKRSCKHDSKPTNRNNDRDHKYQFNYGCDDNNGNATTSDPVCKCLEFRNMLSDRYNANICFPIDQATRQNKVRDNNESPSQRVFAQNMMSYDNSRPQCIATTKALAVWKAPVKPKSTQGAGTTKEIHSVNESVKHCSYIHNERRRREVKFSVKITMQLVSEDCSNNAFKGESPKPGQVHPVKTADGPADVSKSECSVTSEGVLMETGPFTPEVDSKASSHGIEDLPFGFHSFETINPIKEKDRIVHTAADVRDTTSAKSALRTVGRDREDGQVLSYSLTKPIEKACDEQALENTMISEFQQTQESLQDRLVQAGTRAFSSTKMVTRGDAASRPTKGNARAPSSIVSQDYMLPPTRKLRHPYSGSIETDFESGSENRTNSQVTREWRLGDFKSKLTFPPHSKRFYLNDSKSTLTSGPGARKDTMVKLRNYRTMTHSPHGKEALIGSVLKCRKLFDATHGCLVRQGRGIPSPHEAEDPSVTTGTAKTTLAQVRKLHYADRAANEHAASHWKDEQSMPRGRTLSIGGRPLSRKYRTGFGQVYKSDLDSKQYPNKSETPGVSARTVLTQRHKVGPTFGSRIQPSQNRLTSRGFRDHNESLDGFTASSESKVTDTSIDSRNEAKLPSILANRGQNLNEQNLFEAFPEDTLTWDVRYASVAKVVNSNKVRIVIEGAHRAQNLCDDVGRARDLATLPEYQKNGQDNRTSVLPYSLVMFLSPSAKNQKVNIAGTYMRHLETMDKYLKWKFNEQFLKPSS